MREECHKVLNQLGIQNILCLPLHLSLKKLLSKTAIIDEEKLYPNVDFYSGIILKAMGFPTSMFTVLFAVARTVGWVSQWKEMIEDPMQRIGRPRQLYTGPEPKSYTSISDRD